MKTIHSLQTKLTASFVILILVVTSLTFLITYRQTQYALKEITQTELVALATVVASQLHGTDAAALARLQPGDEESSVFMLLRQRLRDVEHSHPDIKYVYTMKRAVSGQVQFIVDADYGNPDDPGGAIGEAYEDGTPALHRGFTEPSVDEDFFTDDWGTFMSGYAPLRDDSGTIVGIVGIDMSSDRVLEKQAFIGNTIYFVMAAGRAVHSAVFQDHHQGCA